MSRVGKQPVVVPAGVDVKIDGREVTVTKGKNSLSYKVEPEIDVAWNESDRQIVCTRNRQTRRARGMHGLARALIQNMVKGLSEGFRKDLQIVGVGYNCKVQGNTLMLNVGFNEAVQVPIPEGLEVTSEVPTKFTVKGFDKQLLGQFCADVRGIRPPEPYKGKGIRYAEEYVRRKVGKALAGAG